MRYLVAVVALAPFVVVIVGMLTGRATVRACCAPVQSREAVTPPDGAAR